MRVNEQACSVIRMLDTKIRIQQKYRKEVRNEKIYNW